VDLSRDMANRNIARPQPTRKNKKPRKSFRRTIAIKEISYNNK